MSDDYTDLFDDDTPGPSDDSRRERDEEWVEHRRYVDEARRDRLSDYGGLDGIRPKAAKT